MNNSPSSFSDEALSELVFESQVTMLSPKISAHDVPNRIQKFNQLYARVATKIEGVALLYQKPENGAVHWQQLDEKLVIGRSPKSARNPDGCDLAINDDELSRRHFEIVLADGFYVLRDLNSRNGTCINNEPERINQHVLKAGDLISAGRTLFAFTGD